MASPMARQSRLRAVTAAQSRSYLAKAEEFLAGARSELGGRAIRAALSTRRTSDVPDRHSAELSRRDLPHQRPLSVPGHYAPGVVRLVVAVLVPYCLPQGRVPRRLVPDQCDQRALPPTRTSLTTAEPGLPSLSGEGPTGQRDET